MLHNLSIHGETFTQVPSQGLESFFVAVSEEEPARRFGYEEEEEGHDGGGKEL